MARLPDIDPATMSTAQKRVYDAIISGPRGIVEGPLRIWLNSPELADRAQALGAFCRFGSSLEPRLSELAIITTGAYWRAGFEWHVHAPIALKSGIEPAVVEAIRQGGTPKFIKADEEIVHGFTQELWTTRKVSPEIFAAAVKVVGTRGVVDLVGIIGYYGLISMTITAFEVDNPGTPVDYFDK